MKIAIIGGGNMGGAIALGAVRYGGIEPCDIIISDPRAPLDDVFGDTGIEVISDNAKAVSNADLVIVAVKPWLMEEVLRGIADSLDRERQAVISIAAGVTFKQLTEYLGGGQKAAPPLYRLIPNTAVSLAQSATFIAKHNTDTERDSALGQLFSRLGQVYWIDEDLMPAVTSLASSGIAYALKYIDAAVKGAQRMGIEGSEALRIVIQTIKGALALLETNGTDPQTEIDKVTTPNGITIKGLTIMENNGFSSAVIKGLMGEE